jgi:O-antigen/teichoic acid export membrane protein
VTRIGRRALAALSDQVISSLTNYVVLFAALRTLSVGDLGIFTFAYTSSLFLITVIRGLALEPLLIRFTVSDSASRGRATAAAAGASLLIGLFTLVLVLPFATLAHNGIRSAFVGFAVSLPVLLLQDVWRHHLFAAKRPWAAAANDAACLLCTAVLTIAVLHTMSHPSVGALLLCWGGGGTAGALLGMLQAHELPRLDRAWAWLRSNRDLGPALAGERSAESSAAQLSFMLVGVLASTVALGQLGAARAIMAPATTLTTSMAIFGVPEAARLRARPKALTRFAAGISAVTCLAVLGSTAVLLFGPEWIGETLAGKNWHVAKTLIVPVTIWTAAAGARRGPSVALRALERGRILLALSIVTGLIVLPATVVGCLLGGARGAAWAFAVVYIGSIAMYWVVYLSIQSPGSRLTSRQDRLSLDGRVEATSAT